MAKLNYSFDLKVTSPEDAEDYSVRAKVKEHGKHWFCGYVSGKLRITVGEHSLGEFYFNNLELVIFKGSGKFHINFPSDAKHFEHYTPASADTRKRLQVAVLRAICASERTKDRTVAEFIKTTATA